MAEHKSVLFRVDAGRRIGNGHLMRCLALAQTLRSEGIRVVFVSRIESRDLKNRLKKERVNLVPMTRRRPGGDNDARDTAHVARKWRAAWVVVDGYHFSHSYQLALIKNDHRLMLVDDYGRTSSPAQIILNQNLHANPAMYERAGAAALLLGTRHILLRPEFIRWRNWRRSTASVGKKLLLTMGGSDAEDTTGKTLQAMADLDQKLQIVVVVGEHYPFGRRLAAIAQKSPHRVRIIRGTDRMAALMAWADLGVSTFGTTSWEMAYMRLPAVSLVVAGHQRTFAEAMVRYGAVVKLSGGLPFSEGALRTAVSRVLDSPRSRRRMSRQGRKLVDGRGNMRVLKAMGLSGKSP